MFVEINPEDVVVELIHNKVTGTTGVNIRRANGPTDHRYDPQDLVVEELYPGSNGSSTRGSDSSLPSERA